MFDLDFTILFKIAQLLLIHKFSKLFSKDKTFVSKHRIRKSYKIEHRGVTYDLSDEDFYIQELGLAKDLVSRINTDQEVLAFFIYKSLLTEDYAALDLGDCVMRVLSEESPRRKRECKFELAQKAMIPNYKSPAVLSIKISEGNASDCIRVSKEKAPLEVLIIFEPYLSELESAAARVGSILDSYTTERHICLSL